MDLILIELFLWAGLIFFFWVLKEGLGNVETDIEDLGLLNQRQVMRSAQAEQFVRPDKLLDAIGVYQDTPIYRYAVIGNQWYCFDHVCPSGSTPAMQKGACFLSPGLIYVPIDLQNPDR
ncbi:MAG TPA: hypothetical protein VJ577_12720 [Burkholderiaceae bacterium]|nr:hypothetical protein [Burkholderiaceae bacterium]